MSIINYKEGQGWVSSSGDSNEFIVENQGLLDYYHQFLPTTLDTESLQSIIDFVENHPEKDLNSFNGDALYRNAFHIMAEMESCLKHGKKAIEGNNKYFTTSRAQSVLKPLQAKSITYDAWSASRWRLHIDPKHQSHGPYAYDKGGAAIEDEVSTHFTYSTNIIEAEKFFDNYQGQYDVDFYRQLHAHCMRENNVELSPSPLRPDSVLIYIRLGSFGSIDTETLKDKMKIKLMDKSAQETVRATENGVEMHYAEVVSALESGKYFAGGLRSYFQDSIKDVEMRIQEWFAEFNHNIDQSKNEREKLIAIATLYKKLECAHPFKDGNGRVNRVLLNQLLVKYGFSETILSNCACAHYLSVEKIVREIERGREEFAYIKNLAEGMSWQEQNRKVVRWEQDNGVQMEYSIACGEQLHQLWGQCFILYQAALELTKLAKKLENENALPKDFKKNSMESLTRMKKELLNSLGDAYECLLDTTNKHRYKFNETSAITQLRQKALSAMKVLLMEREVKKKGGSPKKHVFFSPPNENEPNLIGVVQKRKRSGTL